MAAQQSLRHGFQRLAGPDGLQVSGFRSGDNIAAVAQQLKGAARESALALRSVGGNRIVTWGRKIKEAIA